MLEKFAEETQKIVKELRGNTKKFSIEIGI